MIQESFAEHREHSSLSVFGARYILLVYVSVLGCLTVFTHLAQIISMQFDLYARIVVYSGGVLASLWLVFIYRLKHKILEVDKNAIIILILVCLVSGLFSVYLQPHAPFGTIYQDELCYLSGVAYYIENPSEPLTYEVHYLHSGQEPFHSVAYFVNNAYQLIQSAFSYVLGIPRIPFFFGVASFLAGIMFPLSLYLLLGKFARDGTVSAVGTIFVVAVLALLNDQRITPGGWIYEEIFMGKSIIVSTGMCLFTVYSLEYFQQISPIKFGRLFVLLACLAGLSTTSIMLFPLMGAILFVSYHCFAKEEWSNIRSLVRKGFLYLSSFFYLIVYAIYISLTDTVGGAVYANQNFPIDLYGYVKDYLWNPALPATPIVFVVFSLLAILIARVEVRRFLLGIVLLPFLVINPWSAVLLSNFFRGIYMRIFYILPIYFVIGYVGEYGFAFARTLSPRIRFAVLGSIFAALFCLYIISPTSSIKSLKSRDEIFSDNNYLVAQSVMEIAPQGVMLAPYPISSTIYAFAPRYPQMVDRPIITRYFLWAQGREMDAFQRIKAANLLMGDAGANNSNFESLLSILKQYPEIRSVLVSRRAMSLYLPVARILYERGFADSRKVQAGFILFWK